MRIKYSGKQITDRFLPDDPIMTATIDTVSVDAVDLFCIVLPTDQRPPYTSRLTVSTRALLPGLFRSQWKKKRCYLEDGQAIFESDSCDEKKV